MVDGQPREIEQPDFGTVVGRRSAPVLAFDAPTGVASRPESTGSGPVSGVRIRHVPHVAKISLRGGSDDTQFLAAAGRVLAMVLPTDPLTSVTTELGGETAAEPVTVLNLGPDEWLITAPPGREHSLAGTLEDGLSRCHAAIVDVTENSTIIELCGPDARHVLSKGMPLDIHARTFAIGSVAQTLLAKADVLLHRRDDLDGNGDTFPVPIFDIHIRRSFAEYMWSWLLDAGRDVGIAVDS